MLKSLNTLHGQIELPAFFPDATRGVVKGGVDSVDLQQAHIPGLVINTLHLSEYGLGDPSLTDIHQLMNWNKPIITDSGGFQVMSLIHENPQLGEITEEQAIFINEQKQKIYFSPERSIELQLQLGADILICLDDCTKPDDPLYAQEASVVRTIKWAERSKQKFVKLLGPKLDQRPRPLLFAVIQGGNNRNLRQLCAQELRKIGFDGYCFGGFPINHQREFLNDLIDFTAQLMPDNLPKYAMGIGRPENIIACFQMGYNLFDCVIPTREARHQKLYIFNHSIEELDVFNEPNFYSTIYIQQSRYRNDTQPVSNFCNCHTCQHYSRAYLHHLFKIKDVLALRLATIHNLRFYTMLMERLKSYI